MSKHLGQESTSQILRFKPEKLTIVTDRASELYDERSDMPLDEKFVKSVMAVGVRVPIIIRVAGRRPVEDENGKRLPRGGEPILEVIDGRQRIRAVIEANAILKKKRKPLLEVPAVVQNDTSDENLALEILVSTNENRVADAPSVRAKKALRMQERGIAIDNIATAFGISSSEATHLIALAGLDKKSQAAVDKGVLPLRDASKLVTLPKEERVAAVEEAASSPQAAKVARVKIAREAKKRAPQNRAYVRKLRTTEEIRAELGVHVGAVESNESPDVSAASVVTSSAVESAAIAKALRWVLGEEAPA